LVGLGDGFFRGELSCPSSVSALAGDLAELLAFGVTDSSPSGFGCEGVFAGLSLLVFFFFFFGEADGEGEGVLWCTLGAAPLGGSSSLTCPCKKEASRAVKARPVARQRRKRATAAHRNRLSRGFKQPAEQEGEIVLL
jgi:hypothetical protein